MGAFVNFLSFLIFTAVLPDTEYYVYEANDKGKISEIKVSVKRDTAGYRVRYVLHDRTVDIIVDTAELSTIYVEKIVKGKWEVTVKLNDAFINNYKGRITAYHETKPVYDRHTLDLALRGFKYKADYINRIRLNVPEFMIINADISVIGSDKVSTPVSDFDCWKILMIPRVIFTKIKFYFWIEKEYPHRFIKYSDSTGKNQLLLKEYSRKP